MKTRLYLTLAIAALTLTAAAAPVSQQAARQHALDFALRTGRVLAQQAPHRAPSKGARYGVRGARYGVRGAETPDSLPPTPYYVFDLDGDLGFVIISGDDRTPALLGYAERGRFDEEDLPENLRAWLQGYADELEGGKYGVGGAGYGVRGAEIPHPLPPTPYHALPTPIAPLLSSTWNQGTPYNDRCPVIGGSRCPSGCTATATAQVMYYHRWPAQCTAIPAHTFDYGDQQYTMEALPATDLPWSSMTDAYPSTTAAGAAVAKLMLYVGQAVKMGYTPSGSGASFGNTLTALRTYFDYDVRYLHRTNYTVAQWESIVLSELQRGCPVLYEGYSSGGGHAFVCDGIDADGLFHFNWGWGGWCDGYFRLSILNPDDNTGIGASATQDGYSMGQGIIIGWGHASETENPNQDELMMSMTDISLSGSTMSFGAWNVTGRTASFDIAVASIEDDGTLLHRADVFSTGELGNGWGYSPVTKDLRELRLPEGTYRLLPVSRILSMNSEEWHACDLIHYVEATYDAAGNLTDATAHPTMDIAGVDFLFPGDNMAYELQRVQVTVHNRGDDLNREVHLFASTDATQPGTSLNHTALIVPAGGEETLSLYFTPERPGEHTVWLALDDKCSQVIAQTTLTVGGTERLTTDRGVATFYSDIYYGGTAITLPEGDFRLEDMQAYGIRDNDISSFTILPGYRVTAYDGTALSGSSTTYTKSSNWIGDAWNDRISSIRIQAVGTSGKEGVFKIQSTATNLYWDTYNSTREGGTVQQRRASDSRRSQLFRLERTGRGIYVIEALHAGLYVTVKNGSTADGTSLVQMPRDEDNPAQEFILVAQGSGVYQLVARFCGKAVEVPGASTTPGVILKTATNTTQDESLWQLVEATDGIEELQMTKDEAVNDNSSNSKWYDLSGRRITPSSVRSVLPKGVYIVSGRKVIVR